ncbi:FHOD3 protein, partial [Amia calva]|nr:FHOD3 protein [Amia calva]
MEQLASNKTFRCILATVLAIGNFLNGRKAKGFELGYLGQLAQVRDTASRRPLLHHTCCILLDCFPHCSDLHSEISAVSRASKCDYSQVQSSLAQLELRCQAAREQLRVLEAGPVRTGVADFLQESEERLAVLRAVHRRVINRFHSFLLFLGYCRGTVREMEPGQFCKSVSDFALEYRAAQLNVLQQRQRHTHPRASTHTPPPAKVRDPHTRTHTCTRGHGGSPLTATRVEHRGT